MSDIWYWFKELVIEMRRKNNEIMKQQNGVLVEILLIDTSTNDYVRVFPHSVDLRGKVCMVTREGVYQEIDLKYLLINKTVREEDR